MRGRLIWIYSHYSETQPISEEFSSPYLAILSFNTLFPLPKASLSYKFLICEMDYCRAPGKVPIPVVLESMLRNWNQREISNLNQYNSDQYLTQQVWGRKDSPFKVASVPWLCRSSFFLSGRSQSCRGLSSRFKSLKRVLTKKCQLCL